MRASTVRELWRNRESATGDVSHCVEEVDSVWQTCVKFRGDVWTPAVSSTTVCIDFGQEALLHTITTISYALMVAENAHTNAANTHSGLQRSCTIVLHALELQTCDKIDFQQSQALL